MGMFDYLIYQKKQYQTKNTPSQALEYYKLKDDGTLWHENYDATWVEDSTSLFGGGIARSNIRDEFCEDFTGIIRFYRSIGNDDWEEFEAIFSKGKMNEIREL